MLWELLKSELNWIGLDKTFHSAAVAIIIFYFDIRHEHIDLVDRTRNSWMWWSEVQFRIFIYSPWMVDRKAEQIVQCKNVTT